MSEDEREIRKACMRIGDELDRVEASIKNAKTTLESINTKLMFELKINGDE